MQLSQVHRIRVLSALEPPRFAGNFTKLFKTRVVLKIPMAGCHFDVELTVPFEVRRELSLRHDIT